MKRTQQAQCYALHCVPAMFYCFLNIMMLILCGENCSKPSDVHNQSWREGKYLQFNQRIHKILNSTLNKAQFMPRQKTDLKRRKSAVISIITNLKYYFFLIFPEILCSNLKAFKKSKSQPVDIILTIQLPILS